MGWGGWGWWMRWVGIVGKVGGLSGWGRLSFGLIIGTEGKKKQERKEEIFQRCGYDAVW